MKEQPEILKLVRQWVGKAEEDILNATHSLTLCDKCPVSTVCFHAQQCTEKYLKALLILQAVPFPRTHDLIRIHNLLPKTTRPSLDLKGLAVLNRYGIEARYPGDWEPIELQEAEEAVVLAQAVRKKVRKLLPKEVLNEEA